MADYGNHNELPVLENYLFPEIFSNLFDKTLCEMKWRPTTARNIPDVLKSPPVCKPSREF